MSATASTMAGETGREKARRGNRRCRRSRFPSQLPAVSVISLSRSTPESRLMFASAVAVTIVPNGSGTGYTAALMQPKQINLDLMTPTAESRMVSTVPEAGFTLIEILVAVLVLTIGLLGIASLQLTSLRANRSAYLRTQATILAQDMLERVRGNRVLARSRGYDIALGDAIPPYLTCTGLGNECNPAALRDYDQGEWLSALATLLPAGDGAVRTFVDNTVSPAAVTVTITIRWGDPVDASGTTGFTLASRI